MNFGRIIFLATATFGVSGEIKRVTANTQKVKKEQKHIDTIASWGFHYLQQVNCTGECKEMFSQHFSKKSLKN